MSENLQPSNIKKDSGKELRRKRLNCSLQSLPVKNPRPELRSTQLRMRNQQQRHQGSKVGPEPEPRPGLLRLMKCLLKQKLMNRAADLYQLDLAAAKSAKDPALDGTDLVRVEIHLLLQAQASSPAHQVSPPEIDSNQGLRSLSRRRSQQELLRRLENPLLLGRHHYLVPMKTKTLILLLSRSLINSRGQIIEKHFSRSCLTRGRTSRRELNSEKKTTGLPQRPQRQRRQETSTSLMKRMTFPSLMIMNRRPLPSSLALWMMKIFFRTLTMRKLDSRYF